MILYASKSHYVFVSAGSDTAIIFPEIAYPNLIFPSPASKILKFSDTYISLYVRKLLARLAPWPILYIVKKERKKCSVETHMSYGLRQT